MPLTEHMQRRCVDVRVKLACLPTPWQSTNVYVLKPLPFKGHQPGCVLNSVLYASL